MIGEVKIIDTFFLMTGTRVPRGKCIKITTGHHGWEHGSFTDSNNSLLLMLMQECSPSCIIVGHGGLWLYPKFDADLSEAREMAESVVQTNPAWIKKLQKAREHEFRFTKPNTNYSLRQAS